MNRDQGEIIGADGQVIRPKISSIPPLGALRIPMYVIQMGWYRWGLDAKRDWLRKLIIACRETILECEHLLDIYDEEEP